MRSADARQLLAQKHVEAADAADRPEMDSAATSTTLDAADNGHPLAITGQTFCLYQSVTVNDSPGICCSSRVSAKTGRLRAASTAVV